MMFHPTFRAEKERRLIFDGPAAGAAPPESGAGVPPAVETLTEKQKEIQGKIDTIKADAEAAKDLVDFQVQKAGETENELQARFEKAVLDAANTYHQELLKVPGGDPLKTVNDAFAPAGVRFGLGTDGKLALTAGAPEGKTEKGRELTDDEKQMIEEAFSTDPKQKAAAERLMASMAEGSRELAVAQGFFENFNVKTPAEKNAILTQGPAFQKFLKELPADQQKFVNQLRQTMTEVSSELSDEERGDIVEGAEKELQKFDATKATEIDRNIMLARMQMRGIDTSNPDAIFKKPPELKVFEGSPMERGFNQIMGLIGYVLMSIQKMKDSMKPKEKGADTPAGDKGKTGPEAASGAPGTTERRRGLQTEMTGVTPPKKGSELLTDKEDRLTVINAPAGLDSLETQKRVAESKRPSATAATATDVQKNELRDLDKRISDLTQERDKLQADVTELNAMKREAEIAQADIIKSNNSIMDLLNFKAIPGTEGLGAAIGKLKVQPNDYFQLTAAPDAGEARWAHVNTINSIIFAKLGRAPDQAISVDNVGTFNSPLIANVAMDALYKKLAQEATPKPEAKPAA